MRRSQEKLANCFCSFWSRHAVNNNEESQEKPTNCWFFYPDMQLWTERRSLEKPTNCWFLLLQRISYMEWRKIKKNQPTVGFFWDRCESMWNDECSKKLTSRHWEWGWLKKTPSAGFFWCRSRYIMHEVDIRKLLCFIIWHRRKCNGDVLKPTNQPMKSYTGWARYPYTYC